MKRRDRLIFFVLITFGITLVLGFGIFWFQPAHIPNNFTGFGRVADLLLFALATIAVWHPIMMEVFSWIVIGRIKHRTAPRPQKGLKVAFVTTFVPSSESISLLQKTLPAMMQADYPHDTWVLDEGNDPAVRALCKRLGVRHFSRRDAAQYNQADGKYAAKTKGGNHNAWYDMHGNEYDIVAQIDTDFAPHRSFLTKTLGYFKDPTVAFVGTPQIYGNIHESFIAKGAAEQTYTFYGPLLRGFSGFNTTLLIGANHVLRVKALQSVDHYSAHITEDLLTGMKLHAGGWTSVYVGESLAEGEGPTSWRAYFNQQMRWAYGCIDVLFKHSPRLLPKMTLQRAAYYFFLQQHYFSGLAMVLGLVGLGMYFLGGLTTTDMPSGLFLILYIPLILFCLFLARWVQRFSIRPGQEKGWHFAGMALSIISWPIFFLALWGVLRGKKLNYKVTPKGAGKKRFDTTIPYGLFIPHIIVGIFCVANLVVGVAGMQRDEPVMLFWLIVALTTMLFAPFFEVLYGFVRIVRSSVRNALPLKIFRSSAD